LGQPTIRGPIEAATNRSSAALESVPTRETCFSDSPTGKWIVIPAMLRATRNTVYFPQKWSSLPTRGLGPYCANVCEATPPSRQRQEPIQKSGPNTLPQRVMDYYESLDASLKPPLPGPSERGSFGRPGFRAWMVVLTPMRTRLHFTAGRMPRAPPRRIRGPR
jgi:hypothetical protein